MVDQWRSATWVAVVVALGCGGTQEQSSQARSAEENEAMAQADRELRDAEDALTEARRTAESLHLIALTNLSSMLGPSFQRTFPMERQLGYVMLEATILGVEGRHRFIVDTGAPFVVSDEIAARATGTLGGAISATDTMGERNEEAVLILEQIEVGDIPIRSVAAITAWPGPPNPLRCLSDAGLFGSTALRTGIWQFDFEAREVKVTNDIATLDLEGHRTIPFRMHHGAIPFIEIRIGDHRGYAAIDFGSNRFLDMSSEVRSRAGVQITESTPRVLGASVITLYSERPAIVYRPIADRMVLGPDDGGLSFDDVPISTSDTTELLHFGLDFLEHFVVTIDWYRNELHLQQQSPPRPESETRPTMGFGATFHDGRVSVTSLWSGGAADAAGVELGDQLLAIGERQLESLRWEGYCALVHDLGASGTSESVELRLRRGDEVLTVQLTPSTWPSP